MRHFSKLKSNRGLNAATSFFLLGFSLFSAAGCSRPYVFSNAQPVQNLNDQQPSSEPTTSGDFNFVEYAISSSVRYPLVEALKVKRAGRSLDVNSKDDVPASSWYTPRLGYQKISAQDLIQGPEKTGAPQLPLYVTKAKRKGNSPGFIVEDARGEKYLLKLDPSDYPNLESTINFLVSRLFWGFGYNTPEDYLITFKAEDLKIAQGSEVSQGDIDELLTLSASPNEDDRYQATASLFLKGTLLGAIPQRGTRQKDSNDRIAHENLRVLRALRVFSAWLNQSGLRSDNTMDVYNAPGGQGYVTHYLLDFGEAFGSHGVQKKRVWDGFEHFFSFQNTAKQYATLGFPIRKWENLSVKFDDPRGSFEAEAFDFKHWRETTQFMPIRKSQPDDDYWAAKIIASVSREDLEALFAKTHHPDQDYVTYLIETLLKRREKIFGHVFGEVSAVESSGVSAQGLSILDRGLEILPSLGSTEYEIRYYNRGRSKIASSQTVTAQGNTFNIPLTSEMFDRAEGYLRIEITTTRNGKKSSRPAAFHISGSSQAPQLVGITH